MTKWKKKLLPDLTFCSSLVREILLLSEKSQAYFKKLWLWQPCIDNSSSLNNGNHDRGGVWTLILIRRDFTFLIFSDSFLFLVSIREVYQTQDSVWSHFWTPLSSSKILRYASYFQLSSRCLEMWSNTFFPVRYMASNISYFSSKL